MLEPTAGPAARPHSGRGTAYGAGGPAALPRLGDVPQALVDPDSQPRRAFVTQVMGLPVSVHVRGPLARGAAVAGLVEEAFDRLRADDAEFSTYRDDSAVSRIRRGELSVDDASPRLREVLALCGEAAARTDGAFSAWLPGEDGLTLDPSGLVKGWAVEQAVERLVADLAGLGPHDVMVSAGGDVLVSCARTDTPDWSIAVEDPADRSRVLTTIPLRRGAVATSGTAARGAHVVDPRTGQSTSGLRSATVVGPSLTWADVYATALLVDAGESPWFGARTADHVALLVHEDGGTVVLS